MKCKNKGKVMREKIVKKLNPFEVHINRSKHQVLGRKMKSDRGLPGVSKSKALLKRKQTLLQEYKVRGKSNQFIDQRIGERNRNMTEDDRIMARFAAERMRVFNKKAMFNLSDTEVLTHKGQTLSEIERFEDIRSDDEDDDDGNKTSGALKGKFVENAHFGGGMLTKSVHDRESLIDELIKESKIRKAERQRNKEQTLEATEQLDEEWKTLGMIVTSNKNTEDVNNQKKDQYDIVMRQLKFEPHGQASQRLKTEEEIAKEDKEQLEKLEKERLKQLREIEMNKYGTHRSADDLDDGFSKFSSDLTENDLAVTDNEDESSGEEEEKEFVSDERTETDSDASEVDEDVKEHEKEEEEESEYKTKHSISSKESEVSKVDLELEDGKIELSSEQIDEDSTEDDSSDEECAMDDLTDLMPSLMDEPETLTKPEATPSTKTTNTNKKPKVPEVEVDVELDLPYVLNIPENYESFKDLLTNKSISQQNVIFERLVKSNHPSLEPGNKKKMLTLAGYVIEHVSKSCLTWKCLQVLVSQFNILKEFNKEECLIMIVESLSSKLEDLARNTLLPQGGKMKKRKVKPCLLENHSIAMSEELHLKPLLMKGLQVKFLTWYILVFLRPQGLDTLVPVSKPALSLVCSLVNRTNNVNLALLCCYLLLQDAKISSVVYPEAILFLSDCIREPNAKLKTEKENDGPKVNKREEEAEYFRLLLDFEDTAEEHEILYFSVVLLSDFVKVYRKYPQSKIMFREVTNSLKNIKVVTCSPKLIKEISELYTLLKVLSSAQLPSLSKSARKPKALRQYEPSFHTVTIGKSQRGLPAEVQEEQKLLHKYKHEMKGAMRELRRDRMFLANVKLKEKALSDEERIKKVKEIFSSAAVQQGELRSLKRKK